MTTARDMVTMSLRSIGVLHSGETPSAEEAVEGLAQLNQMLHSWIYDGIDLEFTTLALNDTIPYPEDHMGPIRYNLAAVMCPEYGIQMTQAIAILAAEGQSQLRKRYMDNRILSVDPELAVIRNPNSELWN